ncbi:Phage integrase family protein [Nannocystis exedens]|nr:Phage integrase family protein [Nannocystis exedens]
MKTGPHALRHGAIQQMSPAGVPLDVIRQITGHADFRILQEYLHDDVEATGMVSSRLADFISTTTQLRSEKYWRSPLARKCTSSPKLASGRVAALPKRDTCKRDVNRR